MSARRSLGCRSAALVAALVFCLLVGTASGSRVFASAVIPSNLDLTAIHSSPSGLVLSGTATLDGDQGVSCLTARANPRTLALSGIVEPPCDSPALAGHSIAAVQEQSRTMVATVRIARLSPAGHIDLGPVVVTYSVASDTHLESVYAPGSLWLYAPTTPTGGRALRISEATGRVVQDTLVSPALDRPIIAANANGLYLAPDAETGFLGRPRQPNENGIIYHIGIGAPAAEVFDAASSTQFSGYVSWITAGGNGLWADICQRPGHRSCAITRFNGPSPKPVFQVSDRSLTGYWIVGTPSEGFYTATQPRGAPAQTSIDDNVVRVDPSTGAVKVIATVTAPEFWQGNFYSGSAEAALFGRSLYLLVPPTNQANGTLYRVPLTGAP